MKILVTGASGFIGRNLIKLINKKDHKICLIGRNLKKQSNLEIINSDIYNLNKSINKIIRFNPEILIHLAWTGYPDVGKKMSKKNLDGQKNFFSNISKIKSLKKIIITGSCFEYGNLKGECKESKKITKFNYFSRAKINLYKYVKKKFYRKSKIIWLRLFYVYGKFQRKEALIPYLINNLKKNKKIELMEPFAARDFIHVNEICKSIIKFIDINLSGIYNLGSGKYFNPLEIALTLKKLTKSKSKIIYDRNKLKSNFYANTEKIKKLNLKLKLDLK